MILPYSDIPATAKERDILNFLENSDDKTIIKYKRDLTRNVPYRLQSPFCPMAVCST